MISRDFDLKGIAPSPNEADSVLVIDPNAVLSVPVAA
jgi:hypothetical protein